MDNPFKFGGIVRGPYFADRTEELDELTREMENLSRVFLVSPRRYGKTCLLFNLMDTLDEIGLSSAYIDLNACPDIKSFAETFTHTASKGLETNTDKLIKMLSGLHRLRPKVSVGHDGSLTAGVEVVVQEKDGIAALIEGMNHAETLAGKKNRKLVVIIDEFSDLIKFNGRHLEKALRSEIQQHEHIGYIFSGSEESVMLSMVKDRKRAFYKLGRIMNLGPISQDAYSDFIVNWLQKGGYTANRQDLHKIFELGQNIPHNIQRLCNILWEIARDDRVITPAMIDTLPVIIAQQDSPHYELLWRSASQQQKKLLIALSRTPGLKPFSKEFQLTHGIGPSSSIKASLDSLVKKGILLRTLEGPYQFSDIFMTNWIEYIMDPRGHVI
ncbi:AAA family ATPase [Candidatus Desulfatibia sp.]|uniref:AAA family ATPase n=1 Tax=Candidatus Desulfatibia sp. TaxID=3101189 RepID=UPI0039B97936